MILGVWQDTNDEGVLVENLHLVHILRIVICGREISCCLLAIPPIVDVTSF
jgi:hypothetical protein